MSKEMSFTFALSFAQRMRGLIAREDGYLDEKEVICLIPCNSIHSFRLRDDLDVAFVDQKGEVRQSVRRLPPNSFCSCDDSSWVCERIASDSEWFEEGERIGFISHNQKSLRIDCTDGGTANCAGEAGGTADCADDDADAASCANYNDNAADCYDDGNVANRFGGDDSAAGRADGDADAANRANDNDNAAAYIGSSKADASSVGTEGWHDGR